MKLAIVIVHYHTPELTKRAFHALARDAAATDLTLELVLVNNGSRPADLASLRSLPAAFVDPGRNLGYAGGANLGIRETSSDVVVVMNSDVQVLPGCLRSLAEVLESGAAAAGPKFYWDHSKRFLLPPTESVGRLRELLSVAARRGERWARIARHRWRRHAWRHWSATEPLESFDLSGALLAFRRTAWQRIGPFDEEYRLYFEETDWLQRLRATGLRACFVPAAEAVHLYAQSTVTEVRSQEWFQSSGQKFRRRLYGPLFSRLLERLSERASDSAALPSLSASRGVFSAAAWLEASTSSLGYPAAAWRRPADSAPVSGLPAELRDRLAPGPYWLRSVDAVGRELAVKAFHK